MRILVTDPIIARFAELLAQTERAHEWGFAAELGPAELDDALRGADVVIASVLTPEQAASLRPDALLHVTGAGADRVSVDALPPGVTICNTGHHGAAIAEHVVMTALMLRRRALEADAQMRAGEWRTIGNDASVPFHPMLRGTTMGLLGLGEIGTEVGRLAQALGMRLTALRQRPDAPSPDGLVAEVYGPDRMLEFVGGADVLVVSIPLSERTRGMIGAAELAAAKPDLLLINVARGGVVEEDALFDALSEGRIGGAGIDVWWGAPDSEGRVPASVERFSTLDNTVLTPHHSGHARRVFEQRAADIARNIDLHAAGLPLERVIR
ncbi:MULTISPECIES: 2-hydroxyacid dehydrogenase [unclassified Pseudoclavibacter]|uniref:2-hydroxyacid dehydrogenase n=1 Tax=unclassified Pseudoclavibacter TaxID=2615177 RepID=UPI001BAA5982|nr:2-hydroxyacid dehydrogenase [Pseudoclavibacter sp. Marseille-Q4354]MBS3178290.1 hydroxyacid dehydrogenase [Pseudoclavibacter sp. Marseille-Q4354]